jgi:tRNA A-37 threonylcarbamoyl transferase component Bud32
VSGEAQREGVGGTAASRRFGKYELLQPLAVGGMAELHLARVSGLGGFEKTVVVKRIHPRLLASEESHRLFLQEARVVALLQHPNIAQVYDVGLVDGQVFFAMEHVDGHDLRVIQWAAVRRYGGLPLAVGVAIALGACAGLHHAHERRGPDGEPLGLVHRDVSPSNILVSHDGWTKLVDFGIAKVSGGPTLTKEGAVRGKTSYMSPEQCRCEPLDRRSDVFSLGIVLYELTTATRLFLGRSELETMKRITEEPVPPPSSRRAAYPLALERIVLRALAPRPEDRYQTAEELQLDLEAFARERKLLVSAPEVARYLRGLLLDRGAEYVEELRAIREQRGQQAAEPASAAAELTPRLGRAAPIDMDVDVQAFAEPSVATRSYLRRARLFVSPRVAVAFAGLLIAVSCGVLAAMVVGGSAPSLSRVAHASTARPEALTAARPTPSTPGGATSLAPPDDAAATDEPATRQVRRTAPSMKAGSKRRQGASARPRVTLATRAAPAPAQARVAAPTARVRQVSLVLDPWPTK